MKRVISLKELQDMHGQGQDLAALPADALLTPSAKEYLQDHGHDVPLARAAETGGSKAAVKVPARVSSKSSPAELEAFFQSPELRVLKEQLCEMGRRLWQRAYVDGNGGNMAIRVGEDIALCTPTLVSKGFMKPEDMCLVDLEGNQLAGRKKRTSEILMHLQIMKRQPRAKATVHCHPPYSTGFAVAGVQPPTCMIPEYEVFASVAIAPYRTPGTPEMGQLVADLVDKHNTILMANHGVVSWSHNDLEDAYFKMEILEAYCRTVLVATQLGKPANTMTSTQLQDLLKIKQSLGIPDPRIGLKECELCDNGEWQPGVSCALPPKSGTGRNGNGHRSGQDGAAADPEAEQIVQAVTEQIMKRLRG